MYRDMPLPPPGAYNPDGYAHNPGSSVPGPTPSTMNTSWWRGDRMPLQWNAGVGAVSAVSQIFWRAAWSSPLFDLRPELRGSGGAPPSAVPIWRSGYGAGGRLWLQLEGLDNASGTNSATRSLRVAYLEFAHIYDSQRVVATSAVADISRDVVTGAQAGSVVLKFFPPGDGYPIRFWRVRVIFEKTENIDPLTISASGAYY